jgi:anti-sigma factor RsiW
MTTQSNNNHKSHIVAVCSCPALGCKLPDYIVDLLDDAEAYQVEQHLVECQGCKERYLTVLRIRGEALARREAVTADNGALRWSNDNVGDLNVSNH